jgi:XTP/dITP diphosphohydrolase
VQFLLLWDYLIGLKSPGARVKLIYGSTNIEKLAEVVRLGASYGLEVVDLKCGAEIAGVELPPEIHEPEVSYNGNAVLKARGYARWFGRPCMADDSGLEIRELAGLPGVYTARFGVSRVSEALIPGRSYEGTFVCAVAYAEPSGRAVSVTAVLPGNVLFPKNFARPMSSLPYAYFFRPSGRLDSLTDTLRSDPAFLSHRGLAFKSLIQCLGLVDSHR